MSIFEQITLFSLPDRILLVSDVQTNTGVLCIDRCDCSISLQSSLPSTEALKAAQMKTIYGIIGTAEARFLLVIATKVKIGDLIGHAVFRAQTVDIIDLAPLGPKQQDEDEEEWMLLRDLLVNVLTQPYFYFSYTIDLTHTQQRLTKLGQKQKTPSALAADPRFVWNLSLLSQFLNVAQEHPAVSRYLVPVMHGAVFIKKCRIGSNQFSWSIISRRSRCYVGARLFARGCDNRGHAANYVETEQVVESEESVSSFVQTRGSMPLFWTQYPNLRYKPSPKLIEQGDSLAVFLSHFKEQIALYGKQVMINLVEQKGSEGELALNLRNVVAEAKLSELQYVEFDFHKECAKLKYDRLQLLVDKVVSFVKESGYYFCLKDDPTTTLMTQKGIIRTNCIDSLDRTNVVQSLLATENLKVVVTRMGIPGDPFCETEFRDIFRNTWADNADLLSVQYAGTGALKTDFTRVGKRTGWGILEDGWNACIRYYLNNFMDGNRTDALKVFVGDFTPGQFIREYYASRRGGRGWRTFLPSLLLIFLMVFIFAMVRKWWNGHELAMTVFCFMLITFASIILYNGQDFVKWPVTLKKN